MSAAVPTTRRGGGAVAAVAAIFMALAGLAAPAAADTKRLVVVVAKGAPLTNISRAELRRVFTGETVTVGGRSLVPFNAAPRTREREGFDQAVLGMSPAEVGRYWIDRKVRGQRGAPRALPSAEYVLKVAAKFPGAIGYVAADQLTGDVQPVAIDGVSYTDERYDVKLAPAAEASLGVSGGHAEVVRGAPRRLAVAW